MLPIVINVFIFVISKNVTYAGPLLAEKMVVLCSTQAYKQNFGVWSLFLTNRLGCLKLDCYRGMTWIVGETIRVFRNKMISVVFCCTLRSHLTLKESSFIDSRYIVSLKWSLSFSPITYIYNFALLRCEFIEIFQHMDVKYLTLSTNSDGSIYSSIFRACDWIRPFSCIIILLWSTGKKTSTSSFTFNFSFLDLKS